MPNNMDKKENFLSNSTLFFVGAAGWLVAIGIYVFVNDASRYPQFIYLAGSMSVAFFGIGLLNYFKSKKSKEEKK